MCGERLTYGKDCSVSGYDQPNLVSLFGILGPASRGITDASLCALCANFLNMRLGSDGTGSPLGLTLPSASAVGCLIAGVQISNQKMRKAELLDHAPCSM